MSWPCSWSLHPGQLLQCRRPLRLTPAAACLTPATCASWSAGRSFGSLPSSLQWCTPAPVRSSRHAVSCRAESQPDKPSGDTLRPSERIKQTLAGLDMLLGIEEDSKDKDKKEHKEGEAEAASLPTVDIAPGVLRALAEAEAQRVSPEGADKEKAEEVLNQQFVKIMERAKQLADPNAGPRDESKLKSEFESLLQIMRPDDGVDKDDLKKIKEQVFGPTVFWVTDTRSTDDLLQGGVVVRGTLRTAREGVFAEVDSRLKKLFGEKYEVLFMEDPEADGEEDPRGGARLAFTILPAAVARPKPTPSWQVAVALVLVLLCAGSCAQLGLAANISKLPKETLDWLARPENVDTLGVLPPGLADYDPLPLLQSAVPIIGSVAGVQAAHEIGHRIAAAFKGIKLGPPLFIPNGQLGTFGAISQLRSLVRNRRDLFDVSIAGPAAGGALALGLFLAGIVASTSPDTPKEMLVAVPAQLFQGSLLLGSTARLLLGEAAARAASVPVHPLMLGGWVGLTATALNLLPVGSIDGGRIMQAAFGRGALAVAAFFTYVGLALGFLGSSLALPFGLFVLICQRAPERSVQDQVTPPGDSRQTAAAVLLVLAVLILLPMAPDVVDVASQPGTFL